MNILAHLVRTVPGSKPTCIVMAEDLRGFLIVLTGKVDGDPKQVAVPPALMPDGISQEVKRRCTREIDAGYVAQEISPAQPIPASAHKALEKLRERQSAEGYTAAPVPTLRVAATRKAFI